MTASTRDDRLALEREDRAEHAVGRRVLRPHVHGEALAAGVVELDARAGDASASRCVIGTAGAACRPRRTSGADGLPSRRQQDAPQIRMAVEADAEHVVALALHPVGAAVDRRRATGTPRRPGRAASSSAATTPVVEVLDPARRPRAPAPSSRPRSRKAKNRQPSVVLGERARTPPTDRRGTVHDERRLRLRPARRRSARRSSARAWSWVTASVDLRVRRGALAGAPEVRDLILQQQQAVQQRLGRRRAARARRRPPGSRDRRP